MCDLMAAQQTLYLKYSSLILNYSTETATEHNKLILHHPLGKQVWNFINSTPLQTVFVPGQQPLDTLGNNTRKDIAKILL